MPDEIVRRPRTHQEAADLKRYMDLCEAERVRGAKGLTPNMAKQLNRARTRCLRSGVVQRITRVRVEAVARQVYKDMPFWRKWALWVKYWWKKWLKKR